MTEMTSGIKDVASSSKGIIDIITFGAFAYIIYKVYSRSSLSTLSNWKPLTEQDLEMLKVKR